MIMNPQAHLTYYSDYSEGSGCASEQEDNMYGEVIRFKNHTIEMGALLGAGCSRAVYMTDYVDELGREYVVKRGYCSRGREENKQELWVYKHTTERKYLPKFLDCTEHGEYLLVERCSMANESPILDLGNQALIDFMHSSDKDYDDIIKQNWFKNVLPEHWHDCDMHIGNVGFTLYDNRPVKTDLAYGCHGFDSLIEGITECLL